MFAPELVLVSGISVFLFCLTETEFFKKALQGKKRLIGKRSMLCLVLGGVNSLEPPSALHPGEGEAMSVLAGVRLESLENQIVERAE